MYFIDDEFDELQLLQYGDDDYDMGDDDYDDYSKELNQYKKSKDRGRGLLHLNSLFFSTLLPG